MEKRNKSQIDKNNDKQNEIWKDPRFSHLVNDPRFKGLSKTHKKVKIDKRFESMFNDSKFRVKSAIDKYGRKINKDSSEELKKYYELSEEEKESETSSDEEEEEEDKVATEESDDSNDEEEENDELDTHEKLPSKIRKRLKDLEIDYARGEGEILSDSSSDDESSDDDENEIFIDHVWGELDRDAPMTEESSRRLAVCNMDWDKMRASDIMVLCNSFLPSNGSIVSVTIYPSEFGKERMAEEEAKGPPELVNGGCDDDSDNEGKSKENEEDGDDYHMEKLRQYQLNRLKYFYAVIECDSVSTADKLYAECDGLEYESSATKLDLRFIPEDMSFDDKPHDFCNELPDLNKYYPRIFETTALANAKVELTWDETNEDRKEFNEKILQGKLNEISDADLKKYLAYSSEEEEENMEDGENITAEDKAKSDESNNDSSDNEDDFKPNSKKSIEKYKNLLNEIKQKEEEQKNRKFEMEYTWGIGVQEKIDEQEEKRATDLSTLTPFEQLIEKRKQKKKLKRDQRKNKFGQKEDESDDCSSDDLPDGIDMNDPYFAEEFSSGKYEKLSSKKKTMLKKEKKKTQEEQEAEDEVKRAELALILEDDKNDDKKSHFSLKKIQDAENESKSKKKKKKLTKSKQQIADEKNKFDDNFEIDIHDNRFSAVYTSHLYNIDPSDPHFKKTKAMETLIMEKLKRKPSDKKITVNQNEDIDEPNVKKSKKDVAVNMLVKSIKRKVKQQ